MRIRPLGSARPHRRSCPGDASRPYREDDPPAPISAYGRSKLAQIMHAFELAETLEESGVTANAVHPSGIMDTDMIREAGLEPQSSVFTGRDAVLRLLNEPGVGTGRYFDVFDPARANDQAYDAAVRARLMRLSAELTGRR